MIEASSITTATAAFTAGLITSLHCVGMCGPLACAFVPAREEEGDPYVTTTIYHSARIAAYTLIGTLAGALGAAPLRWFADSPIHYFPWAIVLFFVIVGFGLEQRLPKPLAVSRLFFRLSARFRRLPRHVGAAGLGLATPFLPCGPLYLVFAVAMTTGSPLKGAEFLMAFALGTLPLIWLTHTQYGRIQRLIPPLWMARLQRGLALIVAVMIAWRLLHGEMPTTPEAPPSCPMCG